MPDVLVPRACSMISGDSSTWSIYSSSVVLPCRPDSAIPANGDVVATPTVCGRLRPFAGLFIQGTMLTKIKVLGLLDAAGETVVLKQPVSPRRERGPGFLIALGAFAGCFIYGWALKYLTVSPDIYGIYWPKRGWLLVHVVAGVVALALGPFQLSFAFSRRRALLHRVLGVVYITSVGLGSIGAIDLAFRTDFGWGFGLGLICMGLVWIATTALATVAISRKLVDQHREWMIRSYIVTFGFITFRITAAIFDIAGLGSLMDQLTVASWFCWSVPLVVAEAVIQGRKIFRNKPPGLRLN